MNQTSVTFLDTCRKETRWVTHPGGVLGISSDGDDRRIFLGLKFSIPGIFFFWGGGVLKRIGSALAA